MRAAHWSASSGNGVPVTLLLRHALVIWLPPALAAALMLLAVSPPPPRFYASAFFLALLIPALLWALDGIAGARWGPRAAGAAGAAVVLLTGWQLVVPPRQLQVPAALWRATFASPEESAVHRLRLPLHSPQWQELWWRSTGAYVYVSLDNPQYVDPHLEVTTNGQSLGILTMAQQSHGGWSPWYRLPVERALLERSPVLEIAVRPAPEHPYGVLALYGGHARRLSYGPLASAWHSPATAIGSPPGDAAVARPLLAGHALDADLAPHAPGHQTGRYFFELRFVDQRGWPSVAIMY